MNAHLAIRLAISTCLVAAVASCGSSRSTYARYPGAPAQLDRSQSQPQALEVADKVVAAHGGAANWEKAKQIRWTQLLMREGREVARGEQAWDRWNGRHYGMIDRGEQGSVAAFFELYGDSVGAYTQSRSGVKEPLPTGDRAAAVQLAREAWKTDAHTLCMPFLLHEPGVKLEYAGVYRDPTTQAEYHDLKVTFAGDDKPRAGRELHAIVDKATNLLYRVEIHTTGAKAGFELSDWQTVNGLKFPGSRKNLGNNEVVVAKDIRTGEPDDELYMMPLKQ